MDLNIINNGREYIVDWSMLTGPSLFDLGKSVEFKIHGVTYVMKCSCQQEPNGNKLAFKLYRMENNSSLEEENNEIVGKVIHQKRPTRIGVSKDLGVTYTLMAETLRCRWGPVCWERGTWGQEVIYLKVLMDFGPKVKIGEANVLTHLGHLSSSGIDSDIDFIVKGEKISGHKLILRGAGSPVGESGAPNKLLI